MGIPRIGRKLALSGMVLMRCEYCQLVFNDRHCTCPKCNNELISEITAVYANLGKKGASSFIYELASGIRIKVKADKKFPLDKGVSYSTRSKK